MSKCTKRAMAVAAHPDDIEFGMLGTLLMLQESGYEIHWMNIANGALGTNEYDSDTIIRMRREETAASAKLTGCVFHESICNDIEVFYNMETLSKLVPVIREVDPEIILTHGPYDYMEDHINAGRLAVSAAFCRGMKNMKCAQDVPLSFRSLAVYHSMPHSITDQLRRPVDPDLYVDIGTKMDLKRRALACHKSQKEWLDLSQGMNAYLREMEIRAAYWGRKSEKFEYAEGWILHNATGFGPEEFNPLCNIPAKFLKKSTLAI